MTTSADEWRIIATNKHERLLFSKDRGSSVSPCCGVYLQVSCERLMYAHVSSKGGTMSFDCVGHLVGVMFEENAPTPQQGQTSPLLLLATIPWKPLLPREMVEASSLLMLR